jgi:hypothetical protein
MSAHTADAAFKVAVVQHAPVFNEPCILYADLQPARITEGHLVLDTHGHYAHPDVFHLTVGDRVQVPVTFASAEE